MTTFEEWYAKEWKGTNINEYEAARDAWDAAVKECRIAVLATGADAYEAAKAKDATDYVAGYQDCAVDADEAIRPLLVTPRHD